MQSAHIRSHTANLERLYTGGANTSNIGLLGLGFKVHRAWGEPLKSTTLEPQKIGFRALESRGLWFRTLRFRPPKDLHPEGCGDFPNMNMRSTFVVSA